MATLSLTSLGSAGTVTRPKHLLRLGARRILVNRGLFQGLRPLRRKTHGPDSRNTEVQAFA